MGRYARSVAVTAVGFALAAGIAVSAALADSPAKAGKKMGVFAGVNFVSSCKFGHRAGDDPIVYPGQPGKSHDHTFVGNVSTNASSTLASLQAAATTCQRPADRAGYWMPTLIVDGQAVEPLGSTIYYRRNVAARLQVFPAGLKMIAGDAKAVAPQGKRITFWNCGVEGGIRSSDTPPVCPGGRGQGLRLHVNFPSCWDGRNTDSADHKSHMAYPTGGACPADHPVGVPVISLIYRYPVSGAHEFVLASGGVYSAHADFFNAWIQPRLQQLVNRCLNQLQHCGRGV
jgi:hypothetical protein